MRLTADVGMTKVVVFPGICGFSATIEVNKIAKRNVSVSICSDCEHVSRLAEIFKDADIFDVLKPQAFFVQTKAAECMLHAACPVPVGIVKTIEVEAGLALPKDVSIHFVKDGDTQRKGEYQCPKKIPRNVW
jgi:hypothetical protein